MIQGENKDYANHPFNMFIVNKMAHFSAKIYTFAPALVHK
jgi:hypothetical protein